MDSEQNQTNPEMEQILDEAVERMMAGEPLPSILSSYPSKYREELADLLGLADGLYVIHSQPVPRRDRTKQAAGRAAFLSQGAALSSAGAAADTSARPAAPMPRPAGPRRPAPKSLWQQLNDFISRGFGPSARLAPIAIVLAMLVLVSTSGLAIATNAAVPGDLTYPFKQWVRQQVVNFAPDELKEDLIARQTEAILEETEEAAKKADEESRIIPGTAELIYLGQVTDGRFIAGQTLFEDSYLPSPDALERVPMEVEGDLVIGALVRIWYQIVPDSLVDGEQIGAGINGLDNSDGQFQAISIRVLAPPPTPTPVPTEEPAAVDSSPEEPATATPTAIPTATGLSGPACQIVVPGGWVGYRVRAGDTLSELAQRTNTTAGRLRTVNCLPSSQINIGTVLYVPAPPVPPTATWTPTPRPSATPTATSTPVPTLIPTLTPTPTLAPTLAPTPTPTLTPTDVPAATETPTTAPTQTPTLIPTLIPTETPTTSATATPTETSAPNTPTPTATGTSVLPAPTATPTVTTKPTEGATPTVTPSATATSAPPTLTPTPTGTLAASTATPTQTAPPADTATATPTAAAPTASPTASPTATLVPANTNTPTTVPTRAPTTPTPTSTDTPPPPATDTPTPAPTATPTAVP